MIFPWPSRALRQEAVSDARREKELSRLSARHAADLQEQIEQMAKAVRAAIPAGRAPLRVMLAASIGSTACPVLQSGRLADCPVVTSGRSTE